VKNEYSLETYSELLQLALSEGYVFQRFTEPGDGEERIIYLRHDVDLSMKMATTIAIVNCSMGVSGTFFVQLRSPFYNLLNYQNVTRIRMMRAFKQRIGLHYHMPPSLPEPALPATSDEVLTYLINADILTMRKNDIRPIEKVWTWHNPTPDILSRKLEVPGLMNPYNMQDVVYVSESCMRHTPQEIAEVIKEGHPRLHLLLHPCYWATGGSTEAEVWRNIWHRLINEREANLMNNRSYREHYPEGINVDISG
jgi:hypothetical protein